MSLVPASRSHRSAPRKWGGFWAAGLILLLGWLAYAGSFHGPFVFDDEAAVVENPSIQHLWPLSGPLSPPVHRTVTGRPVANLTLAVNYAIGGVAPEGYHVVNLLIHLAAGAALFGLLRRTFRKPALAARFGADATPLALALAGLWTLHPLQTEAVTYVVQRVESLMGLFFLLTIYAFVRGTESAAPRRWWAASVAACLLGMGSKEVMVSAPLLVLLYDRALVAGSLGEAWRRRRGYYVALAGTWLWLGWLVAAAHGRNGSAGLGTTVSSWRYALTQSRAILHYLRLSLWPDPLVFDYGVRWASFSPSTALCALVVLAVLGGTIWALRFRPVLGFVGAWFFATLAPSSSFVPIVTQSMAEHRMYLALAAVLTLLVAASYLAVGRRGLIGWGGLALACGVLTFSRNADYRSAERLWRATAEACPENPRAYNALGYALVEAGRLPEAIVEYRRALQQDPAYPEAHANLAVVFRRLGRREEAIAECRAALALDPDYAAAHFNLGTLCAETGRIEQAQEEFRAALRLTPGEPGALYALAMLELQTGDRAQAEAHLRAAIEGRPADLVARFALGFLLAQEERWADAEAELRAAIRMDPASAPAHYNLGNLLIQSRRPAEAAREFARSVELDPSSVPARFNLGNTFFLLERFPEAIREYEAVLALDPQHPRARDKLRQAQLHQATEQRTREPRP